MGKYRSILLGAQFVLIGLVSALFIDPAAAQDKKLVPIRIAATPDPVSLPQWIAMKDRIFQKHGLDPQETVYNVNYQGLLAIGAQQGEKVPLLHIQGDAVERLESVIVGFVQVTDGDCEGHNCRGCQISAQA